MTFADIDPSPPQPAPPGAGRPVADRRRVWAVLATVLTGHAVAVWALEGVRTRPALPLPERGILQVALVAPPNAPAPAPAVATAAPPRTPATTPPPAPRQARPAPSAPVPPAAPTPAATPAPAPPPDSAAARTDAVAAEPAPTTSATATRTETAAAPPSNANAHAGAGGRPTHVAVATAPAPVELPSASAAYLRNPPPPYPPLSRRLGEEGRVVLRVRIEPDGTASAAEIHRSSGYQRLDEAARQTVLRWTYVPGKRNGVPEAMWFLIPIQFQLE